MSFQSAEEIWREISIKYNRKPEGWQVLRTKNSREFYDIFISNPKELWQIKLDTIYGKPTGLGIKIEDENTSKIRKQNIPSYGLRPAPLPKKFMEKLFREIMVYGHPSDESLEFLSRETLRILHTIPPTSIENIRTRTSLHGPFIDSSIPSGYISERQRDLDLKLESELRRIMYKKHPFYL
jgi:hypothetical protein